MKQLIVGASLVPMLIFAVTFLVNFISIYYGSSRSIPFTVMVRSSVHANRSLHDILLFAVAKCHGHLFVYYLAVDSGGHRSGKKHERHGKLSLPNERCSKANS